MVDPAVLRWQRRVPPDAVLHRVVMLHLETFLRAIADDPGRAPLPRFVIQELRAFLDCGVLGRGFARSTAAGAARTSWSRSRAKGAA